MILVRRTCLVNERAAGLCAAGPMGLVVAEKTVVASKKGEDVLSTAINSVGQVTRVQTWGRNMFNLTSFRHFKKQEK